MKFSTNPNKYWHVVMNVEPPKGSKVRTVRFGADILARMDTGISSGERYWQIRSLLFPKTKYSAKSAALWASSHNYEWVKVEG
jgi:phage-related protein